MVSRPLQVLGWVWIAVMLVAPIVCGQEQQEKQQEMDNARMDQLLRERFENIDGRLGFWIVTFEIEIEEEGIEEDGQEPPNGQPSSKDNDDEGDADELPTVELVIITDDQADRMRIMMPILQFDEETDADLAIRCLRANYDRALDAKYALNRGVLWSTFVHPLSSLTEDDLDNALRQVIVLRGNTGTTFASTEMIFGGGEQEPEDEEQEGLDGDVDA